MQVIRTLVLAIALFLLSLIPASAATPGDSWSTHTAALVVSIGQMQSLAFNDQLVHFGGFPLTAKIYGSSDGENWAEVGTDELPTSSLYDYAAVILNGNVHLIGGIVSATRTDDVYVSNGTDLTTWSTNAAALTSELSAHCAVLTDDGDLVVIGGLNLGGTAVTTVQESNGTDVSSFTNIGNLPAARYEHACVVLRGDIYVIGGFNAAGDEADNVYVSKDDGVTWGEVGTDSLPEDRATGRAIVYDNAIYHIGGENTAGTDTATVYRSADGENWLEVGDDALPAARSDFGLAAFNGRLWVVGGTIVGIHQDDVYYTDSIVGGSPAPTPAASDFDRLAENATADQSGDISDANLPLGDFVQIASTDSGYPIRFFWVTIAMVMTIGVGIGLARVSGGNLFVPTLGVIFLAGVFAVIGQGIIPLWLHLSLAMVALAATLLGREVLN